MITKRTLLTAAVLVAVVAAWPLASPAAGRSAAKPHCVVHGSSNGVACAIRPVPSLEPRATQLLWRRLVRRPRLRVFAETDDCRPLRAVFYAASEWLRLATKLAANPSPCADYYVSIPPVVGDKTNFRADQAWRIRALGPTFHALAEVHVAAWRGWVTANNATWYAAGVEARRRMADKGFDVALGDGWIVNEFSSAVRRGIGVARAEMRDFVHGLYDGDGGPPTKGGVFDIGVGQGGGGPGATDISLYKSQFEDWLQDAPFWSDMSRYVSDWSQELYGDVRNYAVAGAPLPVRRDYLDDYLRHQLVHVRLGGAASADAAAFLGGADSPLANAAWQWDSGFGWTAVSVEQMQDYVSAQVYALRHFSALAGEPRDHWGFAWAPHNLTGVPGTVFTAQTGAILDRLAAAIHDSGEPVDAADPGISACGPAGQNLWCTSVLANARLNDSWKTLTFWGQLGLAFTTLSRTLVAGGAPKPIAVQTQLRGSAYDTPSAVVVRLRSNSPQGSFAPGPGGPWSSVLDVTIPAGSALTPPLYYADTLAGTPLLTASALGTTSGVQSEIVVAGAPAAISVSPKSASLAAHGSRSFSASATDAYGNAASPAGVSWSVTPASLGTLSPTAGGSTVFTAGSHARSGRILASIAGVSGGASVVVASPQPVGNQRPRIASARFREARNGGRYVTESIRIRYCDDSEGRLLARVTQSRKLGARVRARAVLARRLAPTGGGCSTARIVWRARGRLLGPGRYTVKLRIRDSMGAWSAPSVHSRRRR